jgi:glycosyltransferase involved in cell wall biosynthesis
VLNVKKTIIFISNESRLLGATKVLLHITKYFQSTQKYNIHVVCPTEGEFKSTLQQNNVKTLTPKCLQDYYFHIQQRDLILIRILHRIYDNIKLFFYFYQLLRKNRDTIVYANTSAVRYIALPALFSKTKLLWHVHEFFDNPIKQKIHSSLIKWCADKIIVHSPYLISRMKLSKRARKKVIFFRYFTIFTDKKYPLIESYRLKYDLIFAGKIGLEKGILDLLTAVNNFVKINNELKVVLTGVFVEKDKDLILEYVEKNNLDKYVTFSGFVPDLNKYILESKVVVLPSYRDYLSMLLMDALILEKPVICTDVGETRSIITHNKNGIIISPGNIEEFTEAIIHILNKKNYQRFVAGARTQKAELLSDVNDYKNIESAIR